MRNQTLKQREFGLTFYIVLVALFITSLVVCNLVTPKFISLDLGFKQFTLSAGVLAYPITFLITDLLSEIYGKRNANRAVAAGFFAMLFTILIVYLGKITNAIPQSAVSNELYNLVFGNSVRAIIASMIAYLCAQFIDVKLFHFWKKLTKGKHLWLRNNASTILSQLIDTTLVVGILFIDKEEYSTLYKWVLDGWLFKVLCALFDTPIIYLSVYSLRKFFRLSPEVELSL